MVDQNYIEDGPYGMVLIMIEIDDDAISQVGPNKWTTLQLILYWCSSTLPGSILFPSLLNWYEAHVKNGQVADCNED